MEAGINRNSRLWQVPDTADAHMHSLGPAPFEEQPHAGGHEGHTGMQMLQLSVSADGTVMFGPSGEEGAARLHVQLLGVLARKPAVLHIASHVMVVWHQQGIQSPTQIPEAAQQSKPRSALTSCCCCCYPLLQARPSQGPPSCP
jgi:hypothetical protein